MLEALRSELKRTGFSLRNLGNYIIETDRSALPPDVLNLLLSECPLHAMRGHEKILLSFLEDVEDVPERSGEALRRFRSEKRVAVTAEMRSILEANFQGPRASISAIRRSLFPELPSGHLSGLIGRILLHQQKSIREDYWLRLMSYLDQIDPVELPKPTKKPPKKKPDEKPKKKSAAPKIPRAPKLASTISAERVRGVKPDLDPNALNAPKKRPKLSSHRLPQRRIDMGYVLIDEVAYEALHAHRRRTCVSIRRLLKGLADTPTDLRVSTVRSWFDGSTLAAESRLLEWVLQAYASLPDAHPKN